MDENRYVKSNLANYEQPFTDERAGQLKRYNFGNGAEGVIYVPENVTSDTNITIYIPGQTFKAGLYAKKGPLLAENYLVKDSSDSIVIIPDVNETPGENRIDLTLEMIEQVKKEYNIQNNVIDFGGASLGAADALYATAKYIEQNPNADPQVCVTVDGYSHFYYNPGIAIPKIKDQFIQNGTILIAVESPWKQDVLPLYAKQGINVLRVVYDSDFQIDRLSDGNYVSTESRTAVHSIINQSFFTDNFSDFLSGKTNLPTEGYIYQIYDLETEKWVTIDPQLIDTYEKLNAYFGNDLYLKNLIKIQNLQLLDITGLSVTSDSAVLLNHVNNIISNIKNSSFVQSSPNTSLSFSSTTKIPSSIPEIVKNFYETTANLLIKIADEVQEFSKIGEIFEKDDKALEQEAVELGNIVAPIAATTTVATTAQAAQSQETKEEETEKEKTTETAKDETKEEQKDEKNVEQTEQNKGTEKEKTTETTKDETKEEQKDEKNVEQTEQNKETEKEKTTETTKDETKENIGTETKTQSSQTTTQNKTTTSSNTNKNYNNYNNNSNNNNNNSSSTSNNTVQSSNKETNQLNEFLDFKEVYSDDNKIVYEYNDECRIIVHKDGNEVIGLEHYYKFDNENLADQVLDMLSNKYKTDTSVENIIQKDNYVKVVFKEEVYSNITLDDIKSKYKDLSEITKL